MVQNGFSPDLYTFPVILRSCSKISGIREGVQVHGLVVKMGFWSDLYVQNGLVNMYSVCGEFCDGYKVFTEMPFRDVVSWTSLISGCVKSGLFERALILFSNMDVEPNAATIASVLVGCGRLGDVRLGRGIHGWILKREFTAERFDEECFDGYCPKEALEFFHAMQMSGVEPDIVTLASVLSACASMGALEIGRWVHEYVDRKGIEWDVHLGTAMTDMYAKCGSIDMALRAFHQMQHKNISTYNAFYIRTRSSDLKFSSYKRLELENSS
ncbi:hypothetical protein Syun_030321 [Stephania yunnanensis]|uniref:Pentatricopeptide repeat-containing protein n=1 Tax=Stephania yunnanensis TaxID=152371 RepID=A0AAP0HKE4_9MAGN